MDSYNSFDPALGQLLSSHRVSFYAQFKKLLIGTLLEVLFLGMFFINKDSILLIFIFVISGYLVIAPISRLIQLPRIEIYERGLRYRTRWKVQDWYWTDFDGFSRTWFMKIEHIYDVGEFRLAANGKKVLGISWDYQKMPQLIDWIERKTAAVMYPKYRKQYDDEGVLKFKSLFGSLTLDHHQISFGNSRPIKLDEIEWISVQGGTLVIKRHKKFMRTSFQILYGKNWHILPLLVQDTRTNISDNIEETE